MRTAVRRNDACLVDHLVLERHPAGPLHDPVAGVVDLRRERAERAQADAAVVVAAIGVAVGFTGEGGSEPLGARLRLLLVCLLALLRFGSQRWNPPVRRIDD